MVQVSLRDHLQRFEVSLHFGMVKGHEKAYANEGLDYCLDNLASGINTGQHYSPHHISQQAQYQGDKSSHGLA